MNKEIHARWLIKYPYIVETVYDPDGNGFGRIHDNDYVRTYTRAGV